MYIHFNNLFTYILWTKKYKTTSKKLKILCSFYKKFGNKLSGLATPFFVIYWISIRVNLLCWEYGGAFSQIFRLFSSILHEFVFVLVWFFGGVDGNDSIFNLHHYLCFGHIHFSKRVVYQLYFGCISLEILWWESGNFSFIMPFFFSFLVFYWIFFGSFYLSSLDIFATLDDDTKMCSKSDSLI